MLSFDQLINKFVEYEKRWIDDYTEDEWELVANSYEQQLEKLHITEAKFLQRIGRDDDVEIFDLGNQEKAVAVSGQGFWRILSWYE